MSGSFAGNGGGGRRCRSLAPEKTSQTQTVSARPDASILPQHEKPSAVTPPWCRPMVWSCRACSDIQVSFQVTYTAPGMKTRLFEDKSDTKVLWGSRGCEGSRSHLPALKVPHSHTRIVASTATCQHQPILRKGGAGHLSFMRAPQPTETCT